jgi:hypothetical protein
MKEDWPETYGKLGSQKFAEALVKALKAKETEDVIRKGRMPDGGEAQRYIEVDRVLTAFENRERQADEDPADDDEDEWAEDD